MPERAKENLSPWQLSHRHIIDSAREERPGSENIHILCHNEFKQFLTFFNHKNSILSVIFRLNLKTFVYNRARNKYVSNFSVMKNTSDEIELNTQK